MPTIDITDFGGVLPSVQKRNLPANSAQVAINLDTRYTDLRPTRAAGSSLTTVAAAARSVFRTPISGTWLSSTNDADYVANPVQDLEAERVYMTGHAAHPEAWEAGNYRRLGVPRPAAAPTVTVDEVFQFTPDDAELFRTSTIKAWKDAITSNVTQTYAGYANAIAGPFNDGAYWLPHGTSTSPALPTSDARMGCYCVPVTVTGSTHKATNEEKHGFAVNPALGGIVVTYSAATYLAIPMFCRGAVYSFNAAGFEAAAALIDNPQGTGQLVPTPDIEYASDEYANRFSQSVTPRQEKIAELNQLVAEVARYVDPVTGPMLKQQLVDFYASAPVADAIDAAAESLANTLYELAVSVWNTTESEAGGRPPSDIYVSDER